MADLLRVVEFARGGRPFGVLDLEQVDLPAGEVMKERDSFRVTPGQPKDAVASSSRRHGGSRQVGQTHDNGSVAARWLVKGATEQAALDNFGEFVSTCLRARPGRYIEWRPDGAPHSTYHELRGTASWNPEYKWVDFAGTNALYVEATWPTAPLPLQDQCDVLDEFAVDSLADYAYDSGSAAILQVTGGSLAPNGSLATERRARHVARGYKWLEAQSTRKFTPGPTITGFKGGVTLRDDGAGNRVEVYVDDNGTNSRLRTDVVVAGVATNRASVNLAARIAGANPFWVRGRIEGQTVYAEYYVAQPFINIPVQTAAPAGGAGYALTAPEQLAAGWLGYTFTPQHANARMDDYEDHPFTRAAAVMPANIAWADAVPGDPEAPALTDVRMGSVGGVANPPWVLIGWTPRPTAPLAGAVAPAGAIEAETAAALTTWASAADATYRGGNGIKATAAGAFAASAEWLIDPSTLASEDFAMNEVDVEVWARVELASTLVSPKLTLSARPDVAGVTASRYTSEWGSAGRALVLPSSGTVKRVVRLGILTLVTEPLRARWRLRLDGTATAGSAGTFGIDQLVLALARRRRASPTARVLDAAYPRYFAAGAVLMKTARSDGSAVVEQSVGSLVPDVGLGPLEIDPGASNTLIAESSLVPDDPTIDGGSDTLAATFYVHLAVWPRVHLARGS